MSNRTLLLAVVVTLAISASPVFAQQSCESLSHSEAFRCDSNVCSDGRGRAACGPGRPRRSGKCGGTVPAHCEVKLTIRPSKDSEIKSAVWLPVTGWNGKYQQVGNGGWAGSIGYRSYGRSVNSRLCGRCDR